MISSKKENVAGPSLGRYANRNDFRGARMAIRDPTTFSFSIFTFVPKFKRTVFPFQNHPHLGTDSGSGRPYETASSEPIHDAPLQIQSQNQTPGRRTPLGTVGLGGFYFPPSLLQQSQHETCSSSGPRDENSPEPNSSNRNIPSVNR